MPDIPRIYPTYTEVVDILQNMNPMDLAKLGVDASDPASMSPELLREIADSLGLGGERVNDQVDAFDEMAVNMEGMAENMEDAATASKKPFNLMKKAQMPMPPVPQMPFEEEVNPQIAGMEQGEIAGANLEEELALRGEDNPLNWFFENEDSLNQFLVSKTYEEVAGPMSQLIDSDQLMGDGRPALDVIKDALVKYYESDPDAAINASDPNGQPETRSLRSYLAGQIFEALPGAVKDQGADNPDVIRSKQREANMSNKTNTTKQAIQELVDSTNSAIKKMADDFASKQPRKKAFNMTKVAQHKTVDNMFLWGPAQGKVDPFSRQPISDWHIVERNKGFGLVLDDRWDIDWESIWRGTVMDKYSRPYRNKKGEWVGGYIEKRFEVDKNIPPTSNIQLKPGQRRRPYMPEYASTEARLEAMRSEGERGYGPTSEGDPEQWDKSDFQKIAKTAQFGPLEPWEQEELGESSAGNQNALVETIVSVMSPEQKSRFVDAMKNRQYGDAYFAMGDIELPEGTESAIADLLYMRLSNEVEAEPVPQMAVASTKKKSK